MKKVILFAAASLFVLASCKKDYTCECTYKDGSGATQTDSFPYKNVKKKDAQDACETLNTLGGSDYNCELK